ncbi:APG17-domain-containing protein [Myriangium duriaei CBS 260.36]|uniref:Autophagy-related protein 17 n=1 Tax=Myriangium duriaei CBS 260.36 TaxID=1168546 RepID=A0A9P4J3D2_9PEZI|nr:APG17-domain-containing protein [Myriangium duriaei CBS 260.36]
MSHPTSRVPSPDQPPPLDLLVGYFVSAKKSLSSTSHVYRANEIVEDARALVEEGAVLKAKNAYVRNGVEEQVRILRNIHGGLEAVGLEAQIDFQAVIKSLDVANDRLQATLSSLRNTVVSATLGEPQSLGTSSQEHESHERADKTLYDFIDESTHTNLLDSLRATIDTYNDTQATLHKVRTSLGDSLDEITTTLTTLQDSTQLPPSSDDPEDMPTTIPDLYHRLTTNATDMASLLQNLISHYDLCITALKHTEGGGEAARAATFSSSEPAPLSSGADSPTEASLYAGADAEAHRLPISPAERDQMLTVVAEDAAQVDEVVDELAERARDMSATLARVEASTGIARAHAASLSTLVSQLADLGATALPACVTSASTFRSTWNDLRAALVDRTASLADLAVFYDAFLASYASLLREVERRGMVEAKMRRIADRAMRDIEALRAEDKDMRDQFLKDVGDWLPRDIWPGLVEGPVKWEIRRTKERGLGIVAPAAQGDEGVVKGGDGQDDD